MSNPHHPLPSSARKLSRIAELVTLAGLGLFAAVVVLGVSVLLLKAELADPHLVEQFLSEPTDATFSGYQRWLGLGLTLLPDLFGIIGLWQARKLFGGYRRGEVFSLISAARLRLIGWMVLLMAPVNMIANTLGIALFTHWAQPGQIKIDLSIESGEIFAVAFGLLIVVVGHVMYQAIGISEENESFV